jgi:signal peptidase I
MNEENVTMAYETSKKKSHAFTKFVLIVIAVSGIGVFTFTRFYGFARVSGDSMNPSLKNGQLVMYSTNTDDIRLSDFVIFKNDKQTHGEVYIKRVIAPQCTGIGFVEDPNHFGSKPGYYLGYDHEFYKDGLYDSAGKRYADILLLEPYTINYTKLMPTQEIEVKKGYIYVAGDNRDNSTDSRDFGPVAIDDVIGVVIK